MYLIYRSRCLYLSENSWENNEAQLGEKKRQYSKPLPLNVQPVQKTSLSQVEMSKQITSNTFFWIKSYSHSNPKTLNHPEIGSSVLRASKQKKIRNGICSTKFTNAYHCHHLIAINSPLSYSNTWKCDSLVPLYTFLLRKLYPGTKIVSFLRLCVYFRNDIHSTNSIKKLISVDCCSLVFI